MSRQTFVSGAMLAFQYLFSSWIISRFVAPDLSMCHYLPLTFPDNWAARYDEMSSDAGGDDWTSAGGGQEQQMGVAQGDEQMATVAYCLRDNEQMALFVSYLISEFSYENLCALYEAVLFREQCAKLQQVELADDDRLRAHLLFCSDLLLTRSAIVAKTEDGRPVSLRRAFVALCDKYVATNANLCVNIANRIRRDLLAIAAAIEQENGGGGGGDGAEVVVDDKLKLTWDVFDRMIYDLLGLLADSFLRFSGTKEFDGLYQLQRQSIAAGGAAGTRVSGRVTGV